MTINYNRTGSDRKPLIAAITGAEAKYLGVPSFAYQVDRYRIDRTGAVTFDDRADSEEVENLIERLASMGFEAEPVERETDAGTEQPAAHDGLTIQMPADSFTPEALNNLHSLIAAKDKVASNDKYAFRCFLLRLGFIGAEYKEERKILLRNLAGNGAFKSSGKAM